MRRGGSACVLNLAAMSAGACRCRDVPFIAAGTRSKIAQSFPVICEKNRRPCFSVLLWQDVVRNHTTVAWGG
jgi:hypothetical protein